MTAVDEAVREGSSPAEPEGPESNAEMRACARESVTPAASAALVAVTERVRAAGAFASKAGALLDKPGSLIHAQPMTFKQSRDRHHECANHFATPVLRWLRYAWGYFHLLIIKPALNGLEWVTESPLRFLVALAVTAVIWYFG